ncbi:hypothetical protein V5799_021846 [Amblyomma americanum]|uniref:Monocarboxylate transporter n=1 Tax=Amblyomma americanum TaxID=6943 RepID=A0AAQ4FP67_AMBAM
MGCMQQEGELYGGPKKTHGGTAPGECPGDEAGACDDPPEGDESTELRSHWHVILIAALMDFGQSAVFRSSGFIYVALMDHFDVDHGAASWPVSVLGTIVDAGGILAGPLCQWFGAGPTLKAGALVTAVGVMASVFAPNIPWMAVTLGVIHGAGAGTVSMTMQVFLSMCFVKYRGTAHGIMFMGSILSSLVVPSVLYSLESAYGFDGCLLIFGGLLLHLVPISFLLRARRPPVSSPRQDHKRKTSENNQDVNLNIEKKEGAKCDSSTSSSSTNVRPSVLESAGVVLRLPMFYVILVTWTVMCYNEDIFLTTIVDFAVDKGRIGLPLLADRKVVRRSTLVGGNAILTAASIAILPQANSYAFLVIATLLAACFNGCGMTMHGVLMADYIGMDHLPVGYGVAGILVVPLLLIKPILIGYFRDTLGSYDDLYRLLGAMQVVLFVMWLVIAYLERRRNSSWSTPTKDKADTADPKDSYFVSTVESYPCQPTPPREFPAPKHCNGFAAPPRSNQEGCDWATSKTLESVAYPDGISGRDRTVQNCDSLVLAKIASKRQPVCTTAVSNYGSVVDFNSERTIVGGS